MRKMLASVLVILLLSVCCAGAESTDTVYDALSSLIHGQTFTLTVTARSDTDELAEIISRYGTVTCTLRQENNEILLTAACEGDAYLRAAATKEGVRFESRLIENSAFSSDWATLSPVMTLDTGMFSVTMTGPDHELIRFTCRVSGSGPDDCQVEVDIGYITGPGNVHSLWDGITSENGRASREFFFTFSEEEYGMECEGTSAARTIEGGKTVITREETGVLTYQEEELGEITFLSTLTIE